MLLDLFLKTISEKFNIIIKNILFINIIFFCCYFNPPSIKSQIKCTTRHLEEIYSLLKERPDNFILDKTTDNPNDSSILFHISGQNRNFNIRIDTLNGCIKHIGFYLFPESYDTLYDHNLLRFAERELFYYLLQKDDKLKEILNHDKILLKLNGDLYGTLDFMDIKSILPILYNSKFSINNLINNSQLSNSFYDLTWVDNKQNVFEFKFPARFDLIKGMDKIELENELYSNLINIKNINIRKQIFEPDYQRLEKLNDSLFSFKKEKNFYNFTSNIFYYNKNKVYKPVMNQKLFFESLTNCIHLSLFDSSIIINNKFNGYGNQIRNLKVGFNRMLDYFLKEHHIFVGFEDIKNDSIPVTILFVNFSFNYFHLLTINIPVKFLFNAGNIEFNGDFHSYIRLDNVKNIFSDDNKGKKKFNIQIKQ